MLTWVQCMQSLLKAMNRDLQGLWIARLARDPLLVSGLLLPVWCVGARTRFLMTRCTIPTFVNVFAGNLFIRLIVEDVSSTAGGVTDALRSITLWILLNQLQLMKKPPSSNSSLESTPAPLRRRPSATSLYFFFSCFNFSRHCFALRW